MSRGDGGGLGGRGHGKGSRTGRGRPEKASRDNRSRQLNPKDPTYWESLFGRGGSRSGVKGASGKTGSVPSVDWKEWMTQEAAGRIQSHADKTGRNQDFKARAQSAADKNEKS